MAIAPPGIYGPLRHSQILIEALANKDAHAKIQNAVKLSTGNTTPSPIDGVIPGGAPAGTGGISKADTKVEFTPNEAAIGGKLGISDADRTKYGADPRLTNMNTK